MTGGGLGYSRPQEALKERMGGKVDWETVMRLLWEGIEEAVLSFDL